MGLKEQLIFPEIDYDDILRIRGMNVSITTTANTDEEAYGLLKELECPLGNDERSRSDVKESS